MRDRFDQISTETGARVVAVSFADAATSKKHQEYLNLPFLIGSDEKKTAYRRWGLLRGGWGQIAHPRVLARYAKLLLGGARFSPSRQGDDLGQMGGDFVVSSAGEVTYEFRSARSDLRPTMDTLIEELKKIR